MHGARDPFALAFEQALRPILDEYLAPLRADQRTAEARRGELPGEPKEWLTNSELQQYLGVSRMTLQRYRDSGTLPYSKVGSNVYYRRADVLDLLERNVQRSDKPRTGSRGCQKKAPRTGTAHRDQT